MTNSNNCQFSASVSSPSSMNQQPVSPKTNCRSSINGGNGATSSTSWSNATTTTGGGGGSGNRFIQVRLYWPQLDPFMLESSDNHDGPISSMSDDHENDHDYNVEHKRNDSIEIPSPSSTSIPTVQHVVSRFTIRDDIAFGMFCARVKQNGEELGMLKDGNHGNVDCADNTGVVSVEMRYWDYEEEDWIMVTCDADWTVAKWRLTELCSPPSAMGNSFVHFQHRLMATGGNTAAAAAAAVENRGSCNTSNGSDNLFPPPLMRQRSYQHRVLRVAVQRSRCDNDNQKQRAEAMYNYLRVLKQALIDDAANMVYGGANGAFGRYVVDPSPPTSPIFRRLSQGEPSLMSPSSQLQRMRTMSLPVVPKIVNTIDTQATMLGSTLTEGTESTQLSSAALSVSLPSSNVMMEMTDEDSEESVDKEEVPAISLRKQQANEGIPSQSSHNDRIQKRKNRRRRRSNGKARHERVLSGHIIFDDSERSHLNNFMLYHDPYGSDSSNSSNSDYSNSMASPSHGIDLAA